MKLNTSFPTVAYARGARLTLEDGSSIIDAISSWWLILHGHGQPEIAEAIACQAAKLEQVVFANFTHEPAEELVELLTPLLPGDLQHCFFSDNGSTAVEVGLKMAIQYWWNQGHSQRTQFLAFEEAYHGDTIGAMGVGADSLFSAPFRPLLTPALRIPYPETWIDDDQVESKEAESLAALDQILDRHGNTIAAMIIEPLVQGAGGMRICRPQYLQQLATKLRDAGILLLADEVMTGFGRTGELFACGKANIVPDIICVAKGITGGFLPLAITACRPHIYEAFLSDDPTKTFYHGHSYTANPISCAAAVASLKLLQSRPAYLHFAQRHALRLAQLPVERPRICGTIAAFNLPQSTHTGYLAPEGRAVAAACLQNGVFLRPLGNVIYLLPPYCITDEELDLVYEQLQDCVGSAIRKI